MTDTTNGRPQVPGGSGVGSVSDGRLNHPGARGAKNPRARSIPRQTTQAKRKMDTDCSLKILTYNVRTLQSNARLLELENALDYLNWDIVGLCEIRRKGEETIERDNNIFYHYGEEGSQYGVGFLVAKKWKNNILEFVGLSDRIAVLKFKIKDKKHLTVIQVHAPTSTHPDEEVEDFYDQLNQACSDHRSTWNVVIGDFNAKIGERQDTDNCNHILGHHGLGVRNERGSRFLEFAFGQNLRINNSFFYKNPERRWTWRSPGNLYKNEIDFILSSTLTTITNVQCLNRIKFSSDHRPLRATLKFNLKIQRQNMIKNNIRKLNRESLIISQEQFNLDLKNSFKLLPIQIENVQEEFDTIEKSIKEASLKVKKIKSKLKKLSTETIKLIDERVNMEYKDPRYGILDKKVKRNIRKDHRNFNTKLFEIALEGNSSLKTPKRLTSLGKSWVTCLKDHNGTKHQNREKILKICTNFYKDLYSHTTNPPTLSSDIPNDTPYSCPDNIPYITGLEVHNVISKMKFNKSPGNDGITTEALKIGANTLLPYITNLFNSILKTGFLPHSFCHSNIILLHKKGDKTDINNYRPISLVSHLYKAFVKVLENRISGQLDLEQPAEQAGFRRGLSTTDHLHAVNLIIEKHQENNIPLYLAFVDYTKAFDSITHSSIFQALTNQHIEPTYIHLLRNIYSNSTASIKLESIGPSFKISKGVKQGDPLSPKLFTSTLEEVFRKLAARWEGKGIDIGGMRLTNLRFADDIILFSTSSSELQDMLNDLSIASLEVGLKMNRLKTNVMTNSVKTRVRVDGEELQYVEDYIYLGQIVSFDSRQDKEIARRTENAWRSYWAKGDLMKSPDFPLSLKRKLMDTCILPVLTYGAQTWSLTQLQKSKLKVCQRAMERSILGVKLMDRIRNTELRSQTQIADVATKAAKLKWNWAGHVCRMPGELWAKVATEWRPDPARRRRGRPRRRWRDELDKFAADWEILTQDRDVWREWGEVFAQQWDTND